MVIKFGFSSELAKSMTVFGILLASISGWFLVSAPNNANADGHSTGMLASNFTWAQKLQENLMTKLDIIEKNTTEIAISTKEISTNTKEISGNTKEISNNTKNILVTGLNTNDFLIALRGKNYNVIEAMCKSGFQSISLEVFSKTFGYKYYSSDKNYNILKDTNCLNTEEICTNIVADNKRVNKIDNWVSLDEPLSLSYESDLVRIKEICGDAVAIKAKNQIDEYNDDVAKRRKKYELEMIELEVEKKAFFKSCYEKGIIDAICDVLFNGQSAK